MKLLYYLFLSGILISCKSQQNTIDITIPTYADFRKSQQSFKSDDGNIKYIDRGRRSSNCFASWYA